MSSSEESFELSSSSDSCGDNDILSSIPQLSDELEFFGLCPLPQLTKDDLEMMQSQVPSLVCALIDSICNLLQLHQSTVQRHNEAEDRRHRLADDNKNLKAQVDRLKAQLLSKEQLLSVSTEKERRLNSECEKLQHDLRKEKDEVRRLVSQVSQRDSQHAHELRKKEHEVLHIQDQLRNNLRLSRSVIRPVYNQKQQESNKKPTHETCSSSSSSHVLDMPSKCQGASTMTEEQEDIYKKVIYKFEGNNCRLIEENINLRDTYCKLHTNLGLVTQQFVTLMEKYFKWNRNEYELGEDNNTLKILPCNVFKMPYGGVEEYNEELHLLSDQYVSALQTVLEQLSNHLELLHSN